MSDSQKRIFSALSGIEGTSLTASDGEAIVEIGADNDCLYLLTSGRITVQTRNQETVTLDAPNVFGEISALTNHPVSGTVRAVGDVTLRRIPLDTINLESGPLATLFRDLATLGIERATGRFHGKYIALVAHDGLKQALVDFVSRHRGFFEARAIVSTLNTSAAITKGTGVQVVRKVRSGPLGGDQQIGALVTEGSIDAVIFLRDPMWAPPHDADVHALVRVCELENVPLATNPASAEALIQHLLA